MKRKIAFLMGAGCEGIDQLGLPSGADFKKKTIMAKDVVKLIYSINQTTDPKIKEGSIITYNSTSILYQTLVEYGIEALAKSNEEKSVFNNYLEIDKYDEKKSKIREQFKKIYKEQFYDVISQEVPEKEMSEQVLFLLNNACFYSNIDSMFNYLRKPEKYKREINRVIKLYFAAYQSIIYGLFEDNEQDEFNKLIKSNKAIIEKRKKISQIIQEVQEKKINEKYNADDVYYNVVRKLSKRENIDVSVITTNYTLFAEKLTGLDKSKISYLHGKLDLFEDAHTKRVAVLSDFDESDIIFPFIFIQSGVKPIINSLQIFEFAKAASQILNAEELHIIGYGINSDDEHISNLLRERLFSGKKIIIYLHNNNAVNKNNILKKLGCAELLVFKNSEDFYELNA